VRAFPVVAGTALALAVCAIALFDVRYHEHWRDEAHAFNFATRAPFHRFITVMHVDGVPFLFHLMLKVYSLVMSPRQSLILAGALGYGTLLVGTYRCLESICRRRVLSLVLTALFACTYAYTYEFGIVIRQYGLGLGFALLTSAYLRDALRKRTLRPVLLGTLFGALAAMTTIQAAACAGGSFVAFGLVWLLRERRISRVLPTLAAVPAFALSLYLALPFPGRYLREIEQPTYVPKPIAFRLQVVANALAGCFTPQDWWRASSLGDPGWQDVFASLRYWALLGVAAGAAYSIALRLTPAWRSYRPVLAYDVIALLVGSAAMLHILVNIYYGAARHQLMLGIPLVLTVVGWGAQRSPHTWRLIATPALVLTSFFFAFQIAVAKRVLAWDYELPFSDSKAEAALLLPHAHLLVDSALMAESFLIYRPDLTFRGSDNGGRLGGYIDDAAGQMHVPLASYVRDDCAAAPDRTYNVGGGLGEYQRCLHPMLSHTEAEERFDLFQIDCSCVGASKQP
jgi:hypothetical protein